MLDQSCAAGKAHLRSHSGPGASDVLCGCPSKPEFRIEGGLFRTLILERLRLPLQVAEAVCECGADLAREGRHRAACTRSGKLKTRALAPERTLARVCREAGATVRFNAKLRDMNLLSVAADDERAIEVLASGLPFFFGAQLAVDVTLRCALTADGRPQPGAAAVDGAECSRAREDKERKYPELLRDDRCRLVVLALETGGRWSEEAGSSWRVWLCLGLERYHPLCNTLRHSHGDEGGPGCSLCLAHGHSRVLWWFHPKFLMPWQVLTAHLQIWQICLRRRSRSDCSPSACAFFPSQKKMSDVRFPAHHRFAPLDGQEAADATRAVGGVILAQAIRLKGKSSV